MRNALVALACATGLTCPGLVPAAERSADPAAPWTGTYTMVLRDQERTFVRWRGEDWLLIQLAELADPLFAANKDVVFVAKVRVAANGEDAARVRLYGVDLPLVSAPTAWAARVAGDNVHVFARIEAAPAGGLRLRVAGVEPAPSDRALIDARLAGIAKDDWQGRLAVATWVREQAAASPARDAWQAAGDDLIIAVIEDAAVAAAAGRDAALLEQAIGWCLGLLGDPGRAARLASAPWVQPLPAAERIAKRLRALGYAQYRGRWEPVAEALGHEFEDRFAALEWRDADGYYRLGRWADAHAEFLPRAKDAAWRAYQAGLRADARHPGIRRELGLGPPDAAAGPARPGHGQGDLVDAATGIVVRCPDGWGRNDALGGRAAFVDPRSETAYIAVKLVPHASGQAFDELWTAAVEPLRAREGYSAGEPIDEQLSGGAARRMSYRWREAGAERTAQLGLALNPLAAMAVQLEARYVAEEAESVQRTLQEMFGRMIIPAPTAGGDAAPADPAAAPAAP